jgi:hypothetical protein
MRNNKDEAISIIDVFEHESPDFTSTTYSPLEYRKIGAVNVIQKRSPLQIKKKNTNEMGTCISSENDGCSVTSHVRRVVNLP